MGPRGGGEQDRWSADDPIPPVTWPDEHAGFEADPSSPAGQLQGEARFLQGASNDVGRFGRAALWTFLGAVAIFAVVFGVAYLLHH